MTGLNARPIPLRAGHLGPPLTDQRVAEYFLLKAPQRSVWRHSAYLSMGEKRARMERRAARRRFLRYRLPAYLLLLAAACWAAWQHYRRLYPLEQVCPAEGDRFYDHCQEGRFHKPVEPSCVSGPGPSRPTRVSAQ